MLEENWYCINTKYHKESDVEVSLRKLQIETLNPRIKIRRLVAKKYRWVHETLFPCYIFAKFDYLQFYNLIRYTRGVKKIVSFGKEPAKCSSDMINIIKMNLVDNYIIVDQLERLSDGVKVEIIDGPFAGLVGLFSKDSKASERVYILLETLGKQIRVELDRYRLKAVNE